MNSGVVGAEPTKFLLALLTMDFLHNSLLRCLKVALASVFPTRILSMKNIFTQWHLTPNYSRRKRFIDLMYKYCLKDASLTLCVKHPRRFLQQFRVSGNEASSVCMANENDTSDPITSGDEVA